MPGEKWTNPLQPLVENHATGMPQIAKVEHRKRLRDHGLVLCGETEKKEADDDDLQQHKSESAKKGREGGAVDTQRLWAAENPALETARAEGAAIPEAIGGGAE